MLLKKRQYIYLTNASQKFGIFTYNTVEIFGGDTWSKFPENTNNFVPSICIVKYLSLVMLAVSLSSQIHMYSKVCGENLMQDLGGLI